MDEREFKLEQDKLALEGRRVVVEETKANDTLSRWGIAIPLAVAVLALVANLIVQRLDAHDKLVQQRESADDALAQQREAAEAAFQLKSAEIVMDATGPFQVRGRAIALRELFPDRLSPEFAKAFNPEHATNLKDFENDQIVASKKQLLRLLAEHPESRDAIVGEWQALFPDDKWVTALRP